MTDAASPEFSYIVLIMDWTDTGAHWVKGYKTLEEARNAAEEKCAEHQDIANRVVILRGAIEQIGLI